jgi:ribonuclease BN (tRNA processing enzyme)
MKIPAVLLLCLLTATAGATQPEPACEGTGPVLQVLGSGGPETADKRASSAYLVWLQGKASVLVDAGGGSALRFGQAGARVEDLDAVLFTHFHADHSSDFPALIKSSYFENRQRPLPVFGPTAAGDYPSMSEFLSALFDPDTGAWRYLGSHLNGDAGDYPFKSYDIRPLAGEIHAVVNRPGLTIFTARVTHGPVPALAWRVESDEFSAVFSGDTNGNDAVLEKLATGADFFIAHNAVPEGISGAGRRLHMPPSVIGRIANAAGVGTVIISHRMLRTLGRENETLAAIRQSYDGGVRFADDLDCFPAPVH